VSAPDVRVRVRSFLEANYLGAASASLGDEESLLKSGAVDSIGVIELVAVVQDSFGVRVEAKDIVPDNFDSVAGVVRFVESRKKAAP
jgi:acyl carrier protein